MNQTPPRWLQRLANYRLAYQQLTNAVTLTGQRPLSDLEQQGLIQAFEYTHELAWHVMKDYFVWQGHTNITGSRDVDNADLLANIQQDGQLLYQRKSS